MASHDRFAPQTVFSSNNATYIAELYYQYRKNPLSVPVEWHDYFNRLPEKDILSEKSPEWPKKRQKAERQTFVDDSSYEIQDALRTQSLINAYRNWGHLTANLDPLGLEKPRSHPELDPSFHGFTEKGQHVLPFHTSSGISSITLEDLLKKLHHAYCGTIGAEFMHLLSPQQREWIQQKFENSERQLDNLQKKNILTNLLKAEFFEKFLHTKYPGAKRFGLDGGESLIPALEVILEQLTAAGTETLVLGMAHRGRLSVMANFLNKPLRYIFAHFQGISIYSQEEGSGDVKYHLGYSSKRLINGRQVHLSLTANPSHLEAVSPVALGKVRGKQDLRQDKERKRTAGLLIHGDAAFAGQGIVNETLQLAYLDGYTTGGTIHLIINNQIGFTTSQNKAKSSIYNTDIAKIIQAPIFHVNADDAEAAAWVSLLAMEFRQKFSQDVVIDLVCYRRHGHNESDEPSFTQPVMYQTIQNHPSIATIYQQKLIREQVLTPEEIELLKAEVQNHLQKEFFESAAIAENEDEKLAPDWLEADWAGIKAKVDSIEKIEKPYPTGVNIETLKELGAASLILPTDFKVNSKIERFLSTHAEAFKGNLPLDWSTAEFLAFASLLDEGYPVRLSGQDSGRGTFSHRHAILYDQSNGRPHIPLNHLRENQAKAEIIDSPLSEAAVLGFDYGYSLSNPNALVLWEAQFGDFANSAQVIIDQFIAASENKWLRLSGLVMLLPHGFEGQGPEHSSARLERFLQLCAEDNLQVINCTTPANYFHALRRQIHYIHRKPLIVMTPKSLLRHKLAVSSLDEIGPETHFKRVISDHYVNPQEVERVVICSGKIYYEILQYLKEMDRENVALVRLEQFYPFPEIELEDALAPYKKAKIIWCQEEPKNMGGWSFIEPRLERVLSTIQADQRRLFYAGRDESAAPATGSAKRHLEEQAQLIKEAVEG